MPSLEATPRRPFSAAAARMADGVMCGMMNLIQLRRAKETSRPEELEAYLSACESLRREDFYAAPPMDLASRDLLPPELRWRTPRPSGFEKNDTAFARISWCPLGPSAPSVLILHALMSASDIGYRRVETWFNQRGWNTVFPHLPYHYSRVPQGFLNGELAITSNLIRNAETLRQGVSELRQILGWLRSRGGGPFGLLGTSYGGWTGALLSFLEPDFRFVALIQPIADVEAAIWENPSARVLRRQLARAGVGRGLSNRHAHLSSPLHGAPLCDPRRIVLVAGRHDSISPPSALSALANRWRASSPLEVEQGHFGYRALAETLTRLDSPEFLEANRSGAER